MFNPIHKLASSAYQTVSVETALEGARPQHLATMLFDALLQSLASARAAIAGGDLGLKAKAIGRAVRILEEGLRAGLNPREGGELARNLDILYGYGVLRLTQANLRNDVQAVDEVLRLISPLAQAWQQVSGAADRRAA